MAKQAKKADTPVRESGANPLGTIRRVIWYALRTVLIVSAILALCFGVFTEAMYVSNIYIVTTEGMALRADAVLKNGSIADLRQYFTEEYLDGDYALHAGLYRSFTVESYDYRYDIKGMRVLPWSNSATMVYVERIPVINASANSDAEEGAQLPQWHAMRYSVLLTKSEGRWLISGIKVLEEDPEEEPLPTPDYSQLEG